jgi:hypothetical protein
MTAVAASSRFKENAQASARSSSGGVDWSSSRQTLGDDPHENRQSGSTGAPQREPEIRFSGLCHVRAFYLSTALRTQRPHRGKSII